MLSLTNGNTYNAILVLAAPELIQPLKQKYPCAKIEYVEEYRYSPLDFPKEHFDLIISDDIFGRVGDVLDMAAGLSQYLKTTGDLISSFENLRFWQRILNVKNGVLNPNQRTFTRDSFRHLMTAAFYKSFVFFGQTKNAPPDILRRLINFGYSNFNNDLNIITWNFKASRSTPETFQLKQIGTPSYRLELSKVIHRIEYGVDLENARAEFERLRAEVFDDYIDDFINSIVIHKENFFKNLFGVR